MFTTLGNSIDSILAFIQANVLNNKIQDLLHLFSLYILISITIKGYKCLSGKTNDPVRELIWDMVTKAIIIAFCTNANGWLTLVIEALKEFHNFAGGGDNMYASLDILYNDVVKLSNIVYDKGNFASGMAGSILVNIGFGSAILPSVIIIAIISLSQAILLMITPLAFYCLLYPQFKNVFTQWLSMLLSNTFSLIFINLFFNAVRRQINAFIIDLSNTSSPDSINIGYQMLMMGIVLGCLIYLSRSLAEKLAQVSIDTTTSGAIASFYSPLSKPLTSGGGYLSGKAMGYANKGITNTKDNTSKLWDITRNKYKKYRAG